MDRDSWLASTAAILPDSAIAARNASDRNSQIVQPTALAETPSRTKAAHQRSRSGIDSRVVRAACSIAGATFPGRAAGTDSDIRPRPGGCDLQFSTKYAGRLPNFRLRS